jgi:hypothetical protein
VLLSGSMACFELRQMRQVASGRMGSAPKGRTEITRSARGDINSPWRTSTAWVQGFTRSVRSLHSTRDAEREGWLYAFQVLESFHLSPLIWQVLSEVFVVHMVAFLSVRVQKGTIVFPSSVHTSLQLNLSEIGRTIMTPLRASQISPSQHSQCPPNPQPLWPLTSRSCLVTQAPPSLPGTASRRG